MRRKINRALSSLALALEEALEIIYNDIDGDDDEDDDGDDDEEIIRTIDNRIDRARFLLGNNKRGYVRLEGRKWKGPEEDGAWPSKDGKKLCYRYIRPSGAYYFVPTSGSRNCRKDSFELVPNMALPKLENELEFIDAGRPDNWDFCVFQKFKKRKPQRRKPHARAK